MTTPNQAHVYIDARSAMLLQNWFSTCHITAVLLSAQRINPPTDTQFVTNGHVNERNLIAALWDHDFSVVRFLCWWTLPSRQRLLRLYSYMFLDWLGGRVWKGLNKSYNNVSKHKVPQSELFGGSCRRTTENQLLVIGLAKAGWWEWGHPRCRPSDSKMIWVRFVLCGCGLWVIKGMRSKDNLIAPLQSTNTSQ